MCVVDLPALKTHLASGYTRSASVSNLSSACKGKDVPNDGEVGYSAVVDTVTAILFIVYIVMMLASRMCWGTFPSSH